MGGGEWRVVSGEKRVKKREREREEGRRGENEGKEHSPR